jgi:hypothetical protein
MSLIVPIPVAALQNYLLHEVPQKLGAMIHAFVVVARSLRNAVVRICRETMQTRTHNKLLKLTPATKAWLP